MTKVLVMVEITVDEDNIATLYPNYNINWDDVDDFIEATTDNLQTPFEENEIPINHLKRYGYSIRVLSRNESKLLDI
jgi:hypothetical protein